MASVDIKNPIGYRFSDADRESGIPMAPIEGFNKKPLVTLEEATTPLITFFSDLYEKVDEAKNLAKHCTGNLSIDESAAIILYTMEWHPYTNSFYYILNTTLRDENRDNLKPWFLYLKLIFTALSRLPTQRGTVYRGVMLFDHDMYQKKNKPIWWGFSSCSKDEKVAATQHFLGENGRRTLFIIDCMKGKDISQYSYMKKEQEVLLLPATELQVIKCNYIKSNNLYEIHLKEIESQYQFLEPVSTESETASSATIPKEHFNSILNVELDRLRDRSDAYLSKKDFTDDDIGSIVQEVIFTKRCRVLSLRGNKITSQGIMHIAKSLENNPTLEELYITGIPIDDNGAQNLAKSLSNSTNSNLKQLCLNDNHISDNGAEHFATMLTTNRSLTHLYLPNNCISDRGIQCLAKALTNNDNTALQVLSLEINKFKTSETVNILIEMIKQNQKIQVEISKRGLSRSDIHKLEAAARIR